MRNSLRESISCLKSVSGRDFPYADTVGDTVSDSVTLAPPEQLCGLSITLALPEKVGGDNVTLATPHKVVSAVSDNSAPDHPENHDVEPLLEPLLQQPQTSEILGNNDSCAPLTPENCKLETLLQQPQTSAIVGNACAPRNPETQPPETPLQQPQPPQLQQPFSITPIQVQAFPIVSTDVATDVATDAVTDKEATAPAVSAPRSSAADAVLALHCAAPPVLPVRQPYTAAWSSPAPLAASQPLIAAWGGPAARQQRAHGGIATSSADTAKWGPDATALASSARPVAGSYRRGSDSPASDQRIALVGNASAFGTPATTPLTSAHRYSAGSGLSAAGGTESRYKVHLTPVGAGGSVLERARSLLSRPPPTPGSDALKWVPASPGLFADSGAFCTPLSRAAPCLGVGTPAATAGTVAPAINGQRRGEGPATLQRQPSSAVLRARALLSQVHSRS